MEFLVSCFNMRGGGQEKTCNEIEGKCWGLETGRAKKLYLFYRNEDTKRHEEQHFSDVPIVLPCK